MRYIIPIDGLREMMVKPLLVQIVTDIGKLFGHSEELFLKIRNDEPINMVRSKNRNVEDDRLYRIVSTGELPNTYLHLTEVTIKKLNDEVFDQSLIRPNSAPILQDGEFCVSPSYRTSELTMTLRYYNNDTVALHKKKDSILLNLAQTQGRYVHTIDLKYPLGRRLTALVIEIFKKKCRVDLPDIIKAINKQLIFVKPNEEVKLVLSDYLKEIASRRVKSFVNETKKRDGFTIGVAEKQRLVSGYIDTNLDTIEIEKENNGSYIEFEYHIMLEHPYGFIVNQPIMIYNSLLSEPFRRVMKTDADPHFNFSTFAYTNMREAISYPTQIEQSKPKSYTIPEIDTPSGIETNGRYDRLVSRLIQVKFDAPTKRYQVKLNIRKIGMEKFNDFEFKEEIINFILTSEREYVTKYGRSLFYFTLVGDRGTFTDKQTLILQEDGYFVSKYPLDIRKTYRVCIYVNTAFRYLSKEDQRRIRNNLKQEELNMTPDTQYHYEVLSKIYGGKLGIYAPYEIRQTYLSTLNLLLLSYNLTPEQLEYIKRVGTTREDTLFLLDKSGTPHNPFTVQVYNTDVLKAYTNEGNRNGGTI